MPVEVLHVIQQFGRGGASHALISLINAANISRHRVVSLIPSIRSARKYAVEKGVPLIENPGQLQLESVVKEVDVLHLHFWNTPELYEFMSRPIVARVIVWAHVSGHTAPHVVTPEIASYSDLLVSAGIPFHHLCDRDLVIKPRTPHIIAQSARLKDESEPFTVGIFGTLESSRTMASAVEVFAAADLPGARLLVVGDGDLVPTWRAQAESLNILDRIEFTGFISDVGSQLRRMDVLLHMPRADSFATSDLSLQEALLAGVVPVVTSGTPITGLVQHEFDALVAADERECVSHLRKLFHEPALLARFREQGLRKALREFRPESSAQEFEILYRELNDQPVRTHQLSRHPENSGAMKFIKSLGVAGAAFRISAKRECGWQEADEEIARSSSALIGAGAGGILHYRGYYPDDPFLRYWAGLIFATQGRNALAGAELAAATKAGVLGAGEQFNALIKGLRNCSA